MIAYAPISQTRLTMPARAARNVHIVATALVE
jgi:hypothetical protein